MSDYNKASRADGIVGGYVFSRAKIKLLWGLPTIVLLGGIVIGIGWIGGDVRLHAVPVYEMKHDAARESDDDRERLVVLNTLVQMRPDNDLYRYNLALLKLEDEQPAACLAMMRSLSERGYRDATLWMARRLLTFKTATVTDCDQVVAALRQVVTDEPKNAVAHATLADIYLAIKQPQLAEPHASIAARLDPVYWLKFSRLMTHLGHPQRAQKAAADATVALRDLVAVSPGDVQRRIQWSYALRAQGRLGESLDVLQSGLEQDGNDQLLQQEMCRVITDAAIAERAGGVVDFQRFSLLLQQALGHDPANLATVRELAKIPTSAHNVDPVLLKAIQSGIDSRIADDSDDSEDSEDSEDSDLVSLSAWCAFAAGDHAVAIRQMRSVVEQHPDQRLQLATFLRDAGQQAESVAEAELAVDHFQRRANDESSAVDDLLGLAAVLAFQGNWDKAIAALDASSKPDAELIRSSRIRYRIKHFHNLQTRDASVGKQFELLSEVLEIDKTNRLAVAGLGVLERQAGDVGRRARGRMIDMLANGQHTLQIHSQLGTNAIDRGQFADAIKHLEQALGLSPLDPLICNNLAYAISESTTDSFQLKRSLGLADQALKRLPANPEVQKTKGAILLKLERFEDALREFELVLAQTDNDSQVHGYLARTYQALGNTELEAVHRRLSQDVVPNAEL